MVEAWAHHAIEDRHILDSLICFGSGKLLGSPARVVHMQLGKFRLAESRIVTR
jgi:hypothetical protein